VLQKMKANGYDAVSIYFDWGYHSPAPGVYDFTGVRDIDQLLDIAAEAGIYVIARPGPYINAETTGGRFPGWLTTQAGRARSDAPDYLAAADDWPHHVDAIIKRHQLTDGTGTVILYQIENELASTGTSQRNYMQNLYDTVRSDDITVPIFHNDKGRNGIWVPPGDTVPGTVPGPVDMYAFDSVWANADRVSRSDASFVSPVRSSPSGWTAKPVGATHFDRLAAGTSARLHWQVTVGPDAATNTYNVAAIATYSQAGQDGRTGATYPVSVRQRGDIFVSDLPFLSSTNGWGPVERDTNVGDQAAGDGGPISIAGASYAKGLGTNSVSSVVIDIGGTCSSLTTDVGVDDLAGGRGSVTFTVLADGAAVAQTGVVRGGQPAQHLTANVTGAHLLTLNVGDAGDGNGHDNADWAGAELHCT
jgi:Glycosyl hydrolases family 35/NPCBM/NEW2 domain/NPCBM-associated, NEW3 domain of alpha-galactosidase